MSGEGEEDGEFDRCNGTPAFLAPEMMKPHARYRCAGCCVVLQYWSFHPLAVCCCCHGCLCSRHGAHMMRAFMRAPFGPACACSCRGRPTDVYALGACLFAFVYGRIPFK